MVTLNGPQRHSSVAPAALNSEFRSPMKTTMGMNTASERKKGRAPRRNTRYALEKMQFSTTYTGCVVLNVKQTTAKKNSMHTIG